MAGRSQRRDPTKPGLAGLTDDDAASYREGRVSASEIAARLGVRACAVTAKFRKMGVRPGTNVAPTAPTAASTSATTPSTPSTSSPAASVIVPDGEHDARAAAVQLAFRVQHRLHQLLGDPTTPCPLGAQQLKAAASALSLTVTTLRDLGEITEHDIDKPAEMVLRVMSEEETATLRDDMEREYGDRFNPAAGDNE